MHKRGWGSYIMLKSLTPVAKSLQVYPKPYLDSIAQNRFRLHTVNAPEMVVATRLKLPSSLLAATPLFRVYAIGVWSSWTW